MACERVERLTDEMKRTESRSSERFDQVQKQTSGTMQEALDLSNDRLREITDLMTRMKELSEGPVTAAPSEALQPAQTPPVQLRSRMKVV